MTVKQLAENLLMRIGQGYGDHNIYMASDEEGNSFNPMLYLTTVGKESIQDYINNGCLCPIDDDTVDNIILLG